MKRRTGNVIRTGVLAGSLLLLGDAAVSYNAGENIADQAQLLDKKGDSLQRQIDATPILANIHNLRVEAADTYGDAADLHYLAARKYGRAAGGSLAATVLLAGLGLSLNNIPAPETLVEDSGATLA